MSDQGGGGGDPTVLQLDLRGLHCPMPVLRLRKALRQVQVGAAVEITCTDPLTTIDIPHAVAEDGHRLAGQEHEGSVFRYRIVRLR